MAEVLAEPEALVRDSGQLGITNAQRASLRDRVRRAAATRPFVVFMAFVAVLAGLYYGVIATPLYVSETRFSIRSKDVNAPTGFLTGLLGNPSGLSDITAVGDFISSHDMLNELQDRFDLRSQYAQLRIDPYQSMRKDASRESFQSFYRRHVIVKLDREAETVIVQVKAFDPQNAQKTAGAILENTEQFVNGMSQRLRNDSMTSAKVELDRAQKAADDARSAVTNFRGVNADLDPTATGSFLVSSLGSLQSAAVSAQSQLAALQTYSRPDAPAVKQLEAQLANINRQIALTKAKQSTGSNKPQQVTSFETLTLNRSNAERVLASAQSAYDVARASSEQREKFVVRIVTPNLPQKATDPNRLLEFVTTLIFALAGYGLVALSIAAVRDHQGI